MGRFQLLRVMGLAFYRKKVIWLLSLSVSLSRSKHLSLVHYFHFLNYIIH